MHPIGGLSALLHHEITGGRREPYPLYDPLPSRRRPGKCMNLDHGSGRPHPAYCPRRSPRFEHGLFDTYACASQLTERELKCRARESGCRAVAAQRALWICLRDQKIQPSATTYSSWAPVRIMQYLKNVVASTISTQATPSLSTNPSSRWTSNRRQATVSPLRHTWYSGDLT